MPGPRFERLLPDTATLDAAGIVAGLEHAERAPAERPFVALNMVASLDGHVRVGARTGPLGRGADRALFHALRRSTEAVMVGAQTARTERYGTLVRDPPGAPQPLACLVSGSLRLDPAEIPLLADPDSRVVVLTAAEGEVAGAAASLDYVRARDPDGGVDLAAGLRALRAEHGVRAVLGEGGPTLNTGLFRAGLVDELFLTLAPALVVGLDPLRLLAGELPGPPAALTLLTAHVAESALFLRYAVAPT